MVKKVSPWLDWRRAPVEVAGAVASARFVEANDDGTVRVELGEPGNIVNVPAGGGVFRPGGVVVVQLAADGTPIGVLDSEDAHAPSGSSPVYVGEGGKRLGQIVDWRDQADTRLGAIERDFQATKGELQSSAEELEARLGRATAALNQRVDQMDEKLAEVEEEASGAAGSVIGAIVTANKASEAARRAETGPVSTDRLQRGSQLIGGALIQDGAISAQHVTASEGLWAKFAHFMKVTTQMLVAGGARIGGELLADVIRLRTKIVAGDPAGTHAVMDPNGFHVFRGRPNALPTEVVRLGVAGTDDYLGVVDAQGKLLASLDDTGGGNFSNVTVAETLSAENLLLSGLNVGEAVAQRGRLASFVSGGLSQPAFNSAKHNAGAHMFVEEHSVSNPDDVPLLCLYVGSPLSARVETLPNGRETFGMLHQKLHYLDRPLGVFNQPTISSPTLADMKLTNQGSGFTSPGFVVPFIVPPKTTRGLLITLQGNNTRFSVPPGPHAGAVIVMGPCSDAESLPGRYVAWASDTQYSGYTPPPPKQTYTKTYSPTWGASYEVDSGARYTAYDEDGEIVHGQVPGKRYFSQGAVGFPDLTADLRGADVSKIEVYVHFRHWWNSGGGTAGVGVHNAFGVPGSMRGGSPSVSVSTSRPGGAWVTLPSWMYGGFKSGQYRGILLHPGGDRSQGRYGLCTWRSTRLRVTYSK